MIAEIYERNLADPTDIQDHLPTFVELCVELNARKVIELGVRYAVSTVAWLHGLERTGGHLWSVDVVPCDTYPNGLPGWTFLHGNDLDQTVLDALPDHDVDIVFIDSLHFYEHTLAELHAYAPRVRSGGRIVMHDTHLHRDEGLPGPYDYPVLQAVIDFCAGNGWAWSKVDNCYGLGIIEVP